MASAVQHSPYNRRVTDRHPGSSYAPLLSADGLRVSWGGVFGGVLLAVGLLILLTALGAAIGISAADPGETDAGTLGRGAGIYAALSLLIALFFGGWASTRMGAISDRATGFCEGALVWVVSILLVGYAAASGIGMLAGSASKMLGGATQAIGTVVQGQSGGQVDFSGSVDQVLQKLRDPNTANQIAQATGMDQQQVRSSLNETAQRVEQAKNNPGQAAQEAKQGVARLMEQAKSSGAIEQKAEEMKPAATRAAWISFAALLLSLVTAVFGAMVGRRERVVVGA
jgi:hypothetical protein